MTFEGRVLIQDEVSCKHVPVLKFGLKKHTSVRMASQQGGHLGDSDHSCDMPRGEYHLRNLEALLAVGHCASL